jgi:hypothetical protein
LSKIAISWLSKLFYKTLIAQKSKREQIELCQAIERIQFVIAGNLIPQFGPHDVFNLSREPAKNTVQVPRNKNQLPFLYKFTRSKSQISQLCRFDFTHFMNFKCYSIEIYGNFDFFFSKIGCVFVGMDVFRLIESNQFGCVKIFFLAFAKKNDYNVSIGHRVGAELN